jgi:deoxyadenosine/deoxycytidine kinase
MGNIGSGKSTVVKRLQSENKTNSINYFEEPLAEWGEWLDLFYSNQEKYAFSFQMKVLKDFLFSKEYSKKPIVCERSPYESKVIFAKALLDEGKMNEKEYQLLADYHELIAWKPDVIIYLQASPEICDKRIKIRSRECESGIPYTYLETLHRNYEKAITESPKKGYITHTIDASRNNEIVYEEVLEVVNSYI